MTALFVVLMILLFLGIDALNQHLKHRKQTVKQKKFAHPDLRYNPVVGYTMADGGEPINKTPEKPKSTECTK